VVRRVEVFPHHPAWRDHYRREASALCTLWGERILSVHHVGSTSVPGLSAKPTIDVLVVVRDLCELDALDDQMRARGYEPRGEHGIPGRRYFVKRDGERHTHHIHAYEPGHPQIRDHLAFRDYLMRHPAEAAAYGTLKEQLAARYPCDMDAYVAGKDGFVRALVERAVAWWAHTACHAAPDCV
jgi:GrpB-like predicted nucleotidyltransferase (UPF0157 family)